MKEKIREWVKRKGYGDLVLILILAHLFMSISVAIHELGHVLTGYLLGCPGGIIQLRIITGETGISRCPYSKMIIIALGGPLLAFLYGLWLWNAGGKDSILRLAGNISFAYSVIPSIMPFLRGSDMWKAIYVFGLKPWVGWLIYFGISSVCFLLWGLEVVDRWRL